MLYHLIWSMDTGRMLSHGSLTFLVWTDVVPWNLDYGERKNAVPCNLGYGDTTVAVPWNMGYEDRTDSVPWNMKCGARRHALQHRLWLIGDWASAVP